MADDLALTPQEQALWLLQKFAPESGVSNVAVSVETPEELLWWPLHQAFQWVVLEHEQLRSHFPLAGASPCRRVRPGGDTAVTVDTHAATPDTLAERMRRFSAEAFDLDSGPPVRLGHFRCAGRHHLCLVAHHIVVDHTALRVVLESLLEAYRCFAAGNVPPRTAVPTPAPQPVPPPESLAYWCEQIAGIDPSAMELAGSGRVDGPPTFAGGHLARVIPAGIRAGLTGFRHRIRGSATLNLIMLSAYYLLLAREGAGPNLVVGVQLDGRGGEAGLGYRVNTVPLAVTADPEAGFGDLVTRVRAAFARALEHPGVSYEMLAGQDLDEGVARNLWHAPLFRHLFNFRPRALGVTDGLADRRLDLRHVDTGLTRFDLEMTVDEGPERALLHLSYSTEIHGRQQAESYLDRYLMLLEQGMADPGRPIARLSRITETDRAVVERLNRTSCRWPRPETVPARFRARAAEAPDSVAITEDGRATTYAELLAMAGATCRSLRAEGVGPGDVVAVTGTRTARTAAALLGTWAAGAAYLPLDPSMPDGRLGYQLDDSGCGVVIDGDWLPAGCARGRRLLTAPDPGDSPEPDASPEPGAPAELAAVPSDATAYLLYTSGTTGNPKGVELTHRGLANVVLHFARMLQAGDEDAMLWLTSLSFDISALELWLPLTAGAREVAAPDEARSDPGVFLSTLTNNRVTIAQATPTTWRLLAGHAGDRLRGVRVLCGGEPLSPPLARTLISAGCRLFNVYGPTETTIWSTAAEIAGRPDEITVGRPIANTTAHILDERLQPVPVGVPGELCLGGAGLAVGYRNLPELTAAAFRRLPGLGRIYRTGDLARLREDGAIELLGRTDRQIKLRAHRIEPGEVESVLEEHTGVRAAAVVLRDLPNGDEGLVAYVAPQDACDPESLWEHAARALPVYAVPSLIVPVDALPETVSGKVDYRELQARELPAAAPPSPGRAAPDDDPRTATFVDLWRKVLGLPDLGADANFFLSGGHSLMAARLAAEAGAVCGIPIDLQTIFLAPTPAQLARHVRAQNPGPPLAARSPGGPP